MKTSLWRRSCAAFLFATLTALTARAYVLMDPPYWPDGTVTLTLKLGSTPTYSDGSTPNSTAQIAAQEWNPYMARLQLATTVGPTGQGGDENGLNEVFFSTTIYGYGFPVDVIAVTLVSSNSTQRTESDVIVNSAVQWDSYRGALRSYSTDLRRVIVHELGHVIGLDHPDEAGQNVTSIMNSYVGDIEAPTTDDQDGVAFLYGNGTANPPGPPNINFGPQDITVNIGDPADFSVQASGAAPLTFQWLKDGAAISGATDNVYYIASVTAADAGRYSVTVSNPGGQITSPGAVLSINPPVAPHFYNLPPDWVIDANLGERLSLGGGNIASGTGPITYQWFKNGVPIAGATLTYLQIASATADDAGAYTLVASNTAGAAVSNALTIVFKPQPAPLPSTPYTFDDGVLWAGAGGQVGTFEFQWYKNGEAIPGATLDHYNLSASEQNEAADYVVALSYAGETTLSRAIHIGPAFSVNSAWDPISPDGFAYQPSQIVLGTDNIVYLLSTVHGNVFRWSPDLAGYLGSLPLAGSANAIAYDPVASMLYAGYPDDRITRLDPTSGNETAFANAPNNVLELAMAGDVLFATSATGITSQATFTAYDRDAQLTGTLSGGQISDVAWDEALHKLYYFQNYSVPPTFLTGLDSAELHADGTFGWLTEGPSAGGRFPICISPDGSLVLIGTGEMFDAATFARAGVLPVQIDAAAWLDGRLYTMRDTLSGARIERWTSDFAVDAAGTVPGRTLRLFALPDHRQLAIVENNSTPDFVLADAALDDIAAAPPEIVSPPASAAVAAGSQMEVSVAPSTSGPSYQWVVNGTDLAGATDSTYEIASFNPADSGIYQARLSAPYGISLSAPAILGLLASAKVTGTGTEVGSNIHHPNGNIYDQVLLQGAAASVTADPGQVTRTSYIDLNGDIVQVEFAGTGTLSLVLADPSGPAAPVNYNQPGVSYMQGHAGIVITGADETTNVSVFTVGRATAFDPTGAYDITKTISPTNNPANNGSPLFQGHGSTAYDGVADLRYIAILSKNGKFGGLRASNANFFDDVGLTGVYAPGVQFVGPVYVGNIDAHNSATPVLILGSASDMRITGGSLAQTNNQPVEVSGITQLKFTAGTNSAGTLLPAQHNAAVLEQDGNDVTAQIVVDPNP